MWMAISRWDIKMEDDAGEEMGSDGMATNGGMAIGRDVVASGVWLKIGGGCS